MQHMAPPPLRIVTGMLLGAMLIGACSGPGSVSDKTESEPPSRVYHVQLQLTEDKDRAAAILNRGLQWWNQQPASQRPPLVRGAQSSDSPVSIVWKAPFYRVRIGPFATEEQAERVLETARSAFPDAFVAPERGKVAPGGS